MAIAHPCCWLQPIPAAGYSPSLLLAIVYPIPAAGYSPSLLPAIARYQWRLVGPPFTHHYSSLRQNTTPIRLQLPLLVGLLPNISIITGNIPVVTGNISVIESNISVITGNISVIDMAVLHRSASRWQLAAGSRPPSLRCGSSLLVATVVKIHTFSAGPPAHLRPNGWPTPNDLNEEGTNAMSMTKM